MHAALYRASDFNPGGSSSDIAPVGRTADALALVATDSGGQQNLIFSITPFAKCPSALIRLMHQTDIILTLTGALAAGLVFGYVTNYFRLSPIVGYLLAGVAIGPFTPGFVADQHVAQQLADIGIMLLMFGVGLHFHLEQLLAVKRIAILGAIFQIAMATVLGALVMGYFGREMKSGLVYGLCLSVASTVVLTRVLVDNRQLHTRAGHIALGWLIVEDLFTVLILVLLPILLGDASSLKELLFALGVVSIKLLTLVVATVILGVKVVPWIFNQVAKTSSRELFTLSVLVIALGIAVLSAQLFDVSMALGAFLAGMTVGKSDFSLRAASEALPLRDAFAVLFFVSVGMLLDPTILAEQWHLIAATLAVVVIGKIIAGFLIIVVLGYPIAEALGISVALAQIGEFSFILASLGKQLGILDSAAINVIVATSIISITVNPVIFRMVPALADRITTFLRAFGFSSRNNAALGAPHSSDIIFEHSERAVIVGYGPIGQVVCKLLAQNAISSTVIELNIDTVRYLKAQGISAVYGDAASRDVLEGAGVRGAKTFIFSATTVSATEEIIRIVKAINPNIRIVARTNYASELKTLKQQGCEAVFSGEGEVALAIVEEVLSFLGATAEQIDRERVRVRHELL